MSTTRRLKCAVLGGAAALALSTFAVSPAQADDQPPTELVKVEVPADLEIEEASAPPAGTEPAAGAVATFADAAHPCIGTTSVYGSTGCFQPYGDVIWAKDTQADGMSAAVIVHTDYGRADYACVNSLGNGKWGSCNKDYAENHNVRLEVLRYDGDTKSFYQPKATSAWLPVDGQ